MEQNSNFYSIRQVIELTGMTEFLLRVWENRYGAFSPKRTDTGRRLYTSNDILKAKVLSDLTRRGHKISDIANKSLPHLIKLLEADAQSAPEVSPTPAKVLKFFSLADKFEWDDARTLLFTQLKNPGFIHDFIFPLIKEMNIRVTLERISISQEHIISAFIKDSISNYSIHSKPIQSKARLVFAAPEGDFHDLGLLISAKLAKLSGLNTLYLGPNMPKRELAETCIRFKATHLVLATTVTKKEGAKDELFQFIHFLDRNLNTKVRIWAAGRGTQNLSLSLNRELKVFQTMKEYEDELSQV